MHPQSTSTLEAKKPTGPIRAALIYAAKLRWRVLPVAQLGKVPLLPDWTNRASSDPEIVTAWIERFPDSNLGVATGSASGFFALDVDPKNAGTASLAALVAEHGALPVTAQASTPSGGSHFLFKMPEGVDVRNSAGDLGPGLDVRGSGGQIVIAPSRTAAGSYRWVPGRAPWEAPIAEAPAWLLADLQRDRPVAQSTADRQSFPPATPEVLARAREALERHGPAVQGQGGDQHTFRACAILVNDHALTEEEARPLIEAWNAECQPPWLESELATKLRGGGKYAGRPYGCARQINALEETNKLIADWQGSNAGEAGINALADAVRKIAARGVSPTDRELMELKLAGATGLRPKAFALPPARRPQFQNAEALAAVMVAPTEDAVASLFASTYAGHLRYCAPWGQWFEWRGKHWERERTHKTFEFCREIARRSNVEKKPAVARAAFARGVEAFAQSDRTFATVPEDWDRSPWDLNTPAGTVDLRTGEIREHAPEDCLTRITQVAPTAGPMPVFAKFMREITCGDVDQIRYLRRAIGAAFSGAQKDQWLQFWIGEGGNGKNTLGDFIAWLIGSYAKTIPTETLMSAKNDRHPTEMANLMGVRVAFSSEVPEGSHWNESRIKSLTGDATISARLMRQDLFEFQRTHKHIIYGNHRPQLRVVDEAIRRRMHVVPFRAVFSAEKGNADPDLPEKLRAEGPAILAWLIEGHRLWFAEGGALKRCDSVRRETDDYFESQSTPEMWIAECCEQSTSAAARAADLYRSFAAWKETRGESPMSQMRWGEWMSRRFTKKRNNGIVYQGVRPRTYMDNHSEPSVDVPDGTPGTTH